MRAIAGRLGRAPSPVSREVAINGGRGRYRACRAETNALAAVDTARAQLDPAAVATATARARTRQIGELTDELIIQQSKSTL